MGLRVSHASLDTRVNPKFPGGHELKSLPEVAVSKHKE